MVYDELKGLDPAQLHFALTPCARWDTKNKCVWRDKRKSLFDAIVEDMSGLKPFHVNSYFIPSSTSVADFLRSKMEECHVVIYPASDTKLTTEHAIKRPDGMDVAGRLLRMAVLDKKFW